MLITRPARRGPLRFKEQDPSAWAALHALDDKYAPQIQRAILKALAAATVDPDKVARALGSPTATILDVCDLSGLFDLQNTLQAILERAYQGGADHAAQQGILGTPPTLAAAENDVQFVLDFEKINQNAVRWGRDEGGERVKSIAAELRQQLNIDIAGSLAGNYDVRDLAKIIQKYIGLNPQQSKAFTAYLKQHIDDDPATLQKNATALSDRYRKARAETIARTEVLRAANKGQIDVWDQGRMSGQIDDNWTDQKWIITPDDRICPSCRQMIGDDAITSLGGVWRTPLGALSNPPMHPRCRCAMGLVYRATPRHAPSRPLAPAAPPPAPPPPAQLGPTPGAGNAASVKPSSLFDSAQRLVKNRPIVNDVLAQLDKMFDLPARDWRGGGNVPINFVKLKAYTRGQYTTARAYNAAGGIDYVPSKIDMTNMTAHQGGEWAQRTTLAHEIGHMIHQQYLTLNAADYSKGKRAQDADVQTLLDAIEGTDSYKQMMANKNAASGSTAAWYDYAMSAHELIARSFAQYVADASGVSEWIASAVSEVPSQWATADFGAVFDAWEAIFTNRGWKL